MVSLNRVEEAAPARTHKLFEAHRQFVSRGVTVEIPRRKVHGYLYTIDPESGTHIVLTSSTMEIIPADSVIQLTCRSTENARHSYMTELPSARGSDEIEQNALLDGLRVHGLRAEVSARGVIKVEEGLATISPLSLDGVRSTNAVVLRRVREVVGKIVTSFEGRSKSSE